MDLYTRIFLVFTVWMIFFNIIVWGWFEKFYDTVIAMQLSVNMFLVLITGIYAIFTHEIAKVSSKQTDASLRQNKIADIEKRLENVYNPIYELSRTSITADGCDEDTRYMEGSECNQICNIFKTYSYLIANKKIITKWETADEGNNPMLIIGNSMYLDMEFINLINKERTQLIIEHEKLINTKNQIK